MSAIAIALGQTLASFARRLVLGQTSLAEPDRLLPGRRCLFLSSVPRCPAWPRGWPARCKLRYQPAQEFKHGGLQSARQRRRARSVPGCRLFHLLADGEDPRFLGRAAERVACIGRRGAADLRRVDGCKGVAPLRLPFPRPLLALQAIFGLVKRADCSHASRLAEIDPDRAFEFHRSHATPNAAAAWLFRRRS